MERKVEIVRKTKETDIKLRLNLDGGEISIDSGIGFFDHMLGSFALHGGFSLVLICNGDLNVDTHHTVEDVGIALGQAFREALGDKSGIMRYGDMRIPMDESLGDCVLDISGRPFLFFESIFSAEKVGDFETQTMEEFMRAFAFNAGITLHVKSYGTNDHHKIEAIFKALAHALKKAVMRNETGEVLSAKGTLV